MKLNKLALVLVVVLLASTLTPVFAKSPFADVPADHWAYDSVVELAAAGLIEGYPDGTFGGSRMMTRYEAAMVFARALSRLETQIGNIDVLPELDKIKADLMEEIKAELAALEKPVVETKVIERVVDGELDEETLARIRANEIGVEALEGDIAYVEARVLGLIDGIRYDVNQIQEQLDAAVEQPSLEEIEALIAAKVEEGILEAALSAKEVVKETTIVEKAVATTPEVTEEDVERIAEALINQQLQAYDILVRENREYIVGLLDRMDAVEAEQAEMKEEHDALAGRVDALEKVQVDGKLTFNASTYDDHPSVDDYSLDYSQGANLTLNIKASDTVNVKAMLSGGKVPVAHDKNAYQFTNYGAEVTSEGLVKKLTVGKRVVTGPMRNAAFGPYLIANLGSTARVHFAGLAELDIIDGLSANVLLSTEKGKKDAVAADEEILAALNLKYKFNEALGLKAGVAAHMVERANGPKADSVAGGLFGKIAMVDYNADVAMDLTEEEENLLFGGGIALEFGPVGVNGKFAQAGDNYGKGVVGQPFALDGKRLIEAGVDVEFLGIELDGGYYQEADTKANDFENLVHAFRVGAKRDFDLFVPFSVSAEYNHNIQPDAVDPDESVVKRHANAKLEIGPDAPDYGLSYGASAAYIKNEYAASTSNWKNGNFKSNDVAEFGANVGYKLAHRGADISLGYGADFRMPFKPEGAEDNSLTHSVDFGYGFTKDVELTLGTKVVQTFADEVENVFKYKAGLSISF